MPESGKKAHQWESHFLFRLMENIMGNLGKVALMPSTARCGKRGILPRDGAQQSSQLRKGEGEWVRY